MIDLLLILIYLVLAAALASTAWAVFRTAKIVGRTSGKSHGIPVRRINIIVSAAVVAVMLLSFFLGSTAPMRINAQPYADTFWLRMSDMFVFTGVTCILAAGLAMAFCFYHVEIKNRRNNM